MVWGTLSFNNDNTDIYFDLTFPLSGGKITHNGALPTSNEKMSPTTERLIVLRWLELLHPKLPDYV